MVNKKKKHTVLLTAWLIVFMVLSSSLVPLRDLPAAAPSSVLPDMMDKDTVRAIDRGLKYLVEKQKHDGHWKSGGSMDYPTAMTSLAALALMAGGSTPESGPYSKSVRKALNYLMEIAEKYGKKNGYIISENEPRGMYGHGFAMLFLAQCYGTEGNAKKQARLKVILDRGVKLIVNSQSKIPKTGFPKPYDVAGGWIYEPTGGGDEGSVTVTQLQALRACRNAGIKVPAATITKAVAYLKYCQNKGDGGICYSANSRGSSTASISAAAIACFYAAGIYDRKTGGGEKSVEAKMVEALVKYCKKQCMPNSSNLYHWFYAQFYMAQAMYQRGDEDWKKYFPIVKKYLLTGTHKQFPDGSWNGDGVGNIYGTALACVILQLPYGYLPVFQR